MSKQAKVNSVKNVIQLSNNKKQRKKTKILLKTIVNDFNQEIPMRGLGDLGKPAEW